jgi:hypothetical protein
VKAIARRTGASTFSTGTGALAVVDRNHPTSVYAAFPGSNFEIEIYDPSAARARELAMRLAAVR